VFVRQDLSIPQQLVQSNHATLSFASLYGVDGIPNIVIIGVPNEQALRRVEKKLEACAIPHFSWTEPDYDLGFTAITTAPLTREEKVALANYRVYSPVVLIAKASASKAEDAGAVPAGRANTEVAQSRATGASRQMKVRALPSVPILRGDAEASAAWP
jgi:hypothetical protein